MHPRGRKYGLRELKARRDQVYGEQTSHLVPPISYCLTQERYTLPDVGFDVKNPGARYPVRPTSQSFSHKEHFDISFLQGTTTASMRGT